MQTKVSVIVPAYNCENYIEKCLDSILCQTLDDMEIIAINDGSTDSTGAILDKYAKNNQKITVFHQKNSGVAAARNAGLKAAKGIYIGFVDADDYISKDMFQSLYCAASQKDADLAMCDFCNVFSQRQEHKVLRLRNEAFCVKELGLLAFYLRYCAKAPILWNKIYKAKLIEQMKLIFVLNFGEDCVFNLKLLPALHTVVTVEKELYFHVERAGSITHTSPELYMDTLLNWEIWRKDHHVEQGDYITSLLFANLFTGFMFTINESSLSGNFFYNHIKELRKYPFFFVFCREMKSGKLKRLYADHILSYRFYAVLQIFALCCCMRLDRIGSEVLKAAKRMILHKLKRNNRGSLIHLL